MKKQFLVQLGRNKWACANLRALRVIQAGRELAGNFFQFRGEFRFPGQRRGAVRRWPDKGHDLADRPFRIVVHLFAKNWRGAARPVNAKPVHPHAEHLGIVDARHKIGIARTDYGSYNGPVLRKGNQVRHQQTVNPFLLAGGIDRAIAQLDVGQAPDFLVLLCGQAIWPKPVIPVYAQGPGFGRDPLYLTQQGFPHQPRIKVNINAPALFSKQDL